METVKTQGVVLRHYDYSENSLLVHFFTENMGKVKAMVKGAKKPKGRFFGRLELCSVAELVIRHHSRSDLHLLTGASLIDAMEPIRLDVAKFAHAMVILEVVDSAFEVESSNVLFYRDLTDGMRLICERPTDLWLCTLIHLRMLHSLGLLPAQDVCLECAQPLAGSFYFSFRQGASLCKKCSQNIDAVHARERGSLSRSTAVVGQSWQIPYLQRVANGSLIECADISNSLKPHQKRQFFDWTRNILDGVVHKRIRSYDFLMQVGLS